MAAEETPDPEAGDRWARKTFIWTAILGACFVGSAVFFILLR